MKKDLSSLEDELLFALPCEPLSTWFTLKPRRNEFRSNLIPSNLPPTVATYRDYRYSLIAKV